MNKAAGMVNKAGNYSIILRGVRRVWNYRNMIREEVIDCKTVYGNDCERRRKKNYKYLVGFNVTDVNLAKGL